MFFYIFEVFLNIGKIDTVLPERALSLDYPCLQVYRYQMHPQRRCILSVFQLSIVIMHS